MTLKLAFAVLFFCCAFLGLGNAVGFEPPYNYRGSNLRRTMQQPPILAPDSGPNFGFSGGFEVIGGNPGGSGCGLCSLNVLAGNNRDRFSPTNTPKNKAQ